MLAYCDYIMSRIRNELIVAASETAAPVAVQRVGRVEFDLNEAGSFMSTTKRLRVIVEGKEYLVTVEEVKE
jgi:hypothetical protein